MIILDTYIIGAAILIIGWWMMVFFMDLLAGCGGINYKKLIPNGLFGTGLILIGLACLQYITIFST